MSSCCRKVTAVVRRLARNVRPLTIDCVIETTVCSTRLIAPSTTPLMRSMTAVIWPVIPPNRLPKIALNGARSVGRTGFPERIAVMAPRIAPPTWLITLRTPLKTRLTIPLTPSLSEPRCVRISVAMPVATLRTPLVTVVTRFFAERERLAEEAADAR